MPLLALSDIPLPLHFIPGEYRLSHAATAWERADCHRLRRQIFCEEQKIFTTDDRDAIDDVCIHLAAWSCMFGHTDEIVGTVRIHEPSPGLWWGSRLAVARPFRRIGGLGPALIRLAVGTARAAGAQSFLAHVQAQNRALFESLNWQTLDEKTIHGRPHLLMQADLAAYEPISGTALRVLPALSTAR
ncbi:MAG: GNAT family N-acetyltransferase [Acidocella sp.]|nr:GNAT family N-acetyltransferase [Acidocella sp.]